LETPATVVPQTVDDRSQLQWLRGRLRQLAIHFGYLEVRLITHYNDQYRYFSISCIGGTQRQQQSLIAKLTAPLTPEYMARNKEACHPWADASNPQVNFNNFEDALRCIH